MIRHLEWLLTGWIVLFLLAAPLPFGGIAPWAVAALQAAGFVALVLAAWLVERPRALRSALLPAAALAGIALLGFLQSLPWPAGLAGWISPGHAEVWQEAADLPGVTASGTPRLTLSPEASRAAALTWAAAAAVLLAAAAVGQRRARRRWLLGALLAGALFQIFFGARQWLTNSRTLWGVEIPVIPRLHGTFVNSNHLALYLEMALPAAFAWSWWASRRARMESHVERKVLLLVPPCVLWLTLFLGLAFTGSRGGMLGAVAGLAVQVAILAVIRRRWSTALAGLGALVIGLAVVAVVGLRQGLGRFLDNSLRNEGVGFRLQEYAATLDLWQRFPLFGSGLGTFRDAFPRVQPAELQGTWWHGHSDFLELLATTGLVGGVLLLIGLAAIPRRLLRVVAGRGRSENRAGALAVLGALVSVLIHETMDFGLTMPANAFTLAALVGAGLAIPPGAPRPERPGRPEAEEEPEPEEVPPPPRPKRKRRRR